MKLPIDEHLDAIVETIIEHRGVVLEAPPGTGKSTKLPLALLKSDRFDHGKILVLEPRRVAARAIASRLAELDGSRRGQRIGWQVRFETVASKDTRVLVVTEGIVLRKLQADPLLTDVAVVVLDEFHERSIYTDLTLAFLREVMHARDDLFVVVMSATMETSPVANFLEIPTYHVESPHFPVETTWMALDTHPVEDAVLTAVKSVPEDGGDTLVFASGAADIQRCVTTLKRHLPGLDIIPLYGALSARKQDRALTRKSQDPTRITVATNIAETSLTLPAITTVIDTGRVKRPYYSRRRGFDVLEEGWVSLASATQRAGRAGRLGPGRAIRLWDRTREFRFDEWEEPEIQRVDLASTLLEVIGWSARNPHDFQFFEPPTQAAIEEALARLQALGALEDNATRLTDIGEKLLQLPLPPRLARMLLEGQQRGVRRQVATIAAVLSEGVRAAPPPYDIDCDPLHVFQSLDGGKRKRVERVRDQLERLAPESARAKSDDFATIAKSVLVGYSDRIAFARGEHDYLMVGGVELRKGRDSGVRADIVAALDIGSGGTTSSAYLGSACRMEEEWLREVLPERFSIRNECRFDSDLERVVVRKMESFDDVVLMTQSASVQEADPAQVSENLAEAVIARFDHALRPSKEALALIERLACLRQWYEGELEVPDIRGQINPDFVRNLCVGKHSFAELRKVDLKGWILGLLPYEVRQTLDAELPERIEVPTGRKLRIQYQEGEPPILAARIQHLFGMYETPVIAGGRTEILVHLLAPNGRPQQVTSDLRSFWERTWPQVRKELRGRYPKHDWPEEP